MANQKPAPPVAAAVPKLALNEYEMADALGLSVHTLRKDRQRERRIPFFKIGSSVRYDVRRVQEALAAFEESGSGEKK